MAITPSYLNPAAYHNQVIDLSHGDPGADAFRTVHGHVLEKIEQQVHEAVRKNEYPPAERHGIRTRADGLIKSLRPVDQGVVFFIDGTRGAGKSTFIRAACRSLCIDLNEAEASSVANNRPRIGFLSMIDPSRIETREVLLLNVVTLLKKRVDLLPRSLCERGDRRQDHQSFRDCLEKLAGGLSLLKHDYDPLKDADPEVFLTAGLERVQHGTDLREAFHDLVDAACRMLGMDALVLAFDDSDTNARKGIELMETLRQYLNSPRLVILVAGDMELYSLLVRKHFVQTSDVGRSTVDESRNPQRGVMLDHLEEQYLLKLFPSQRRYRLVSIWGLAGSGLNIRVAYDGWGRDRAVQLDEFVNYLIRFGFFVCSASEVNLYKNYLLNLPIRSIVQLFRQCALFMGIRKETDQSPQLDVPDAMTKVAGLFEFQNGFSENIRAISVAGLYSKNVNVDDIVAGDMSALISSVFHLVVSDGQYDTGAYLRPKAQDERVRACYAALAAEVARMCLARPDRFLRYLMQAVASVSLYGAHYKTFGKSPQLFSQYIGLNGKEDALHWAWCTAPWLGAPITMPPRPFNKQNFVARLSLAFHYRDDGGKNLYGSGFILLGLIERILSLRYEKISTVGGMSPFLEFDIRSVLERAWRIPSVSSVPEIPGGVAMLFPEENNAEPIKIDESSELMKKLIDDLARWLHESVSAEGSVAISAVFSGKVWTRIYFNINNKNPGGRGQGIVDYLRNLFLCILKAIYIEGFVPHSFETVLAHQRRDANSLGLVGADFNEVMGWDCKKFREKYESHKRKSVDFPLLRLLLSCPLVQWLIPEWEGLGSNQDAPRGMPPLGRSEPKPGLPWLRSGATASWICSKKRHFTSHCPAIGLKKLFT